MRHTRSGLTIAALAFLGAASAGAQAVSTTVGRLQPFSDDGKATSKGKVDTTAVALYAGAFLGPVGNVPGLSPDAQQGFLYESVNFLFSATTIPTPGGPDYEVVGNLRRLHAHVTLTPLDSAQKPLTNRSDLEVIATFPDTVVLAQQTADSSSSSVAGAAFSTVTHSLVPALQAGETLGQKMGPAVATFLHLYHKPSAQLEVGYISDQRDFGWLWYGRDQVVIDGMHHSSVALEVGPGTRFVRVHMRLSAEWKSHGSWMRDVDLVLQLPGTGMAGPRD